MKKLIFLLIFTCIGYTLTAQNHRMKYYYDDEYECWNLEDSTSYRTDIPVVQLDGTPGDPRVALAKDLTGTLDLRLVEFILTPDVLARYKAEGLTKFGFTYIILPNGTVDEISFNFLVFGEKLNITESDMILWRLLSDTLKELITFSIEPNIQKLQFYRMGRSVFLSDLEI